MKKFLGTLALITSTSPALASTLTCWYEESGNFTDSQPGNQIGVTTWAGDHCGYAVSACSDPNFPVHVAKTGDRAWAYVISEWQVRDDGLGPCLIYLGKVYEFNEKKN